jgi:DNA-binding response OmpR family regulator
LIVDDSIVTRKLVARAFKKANFIADTAQNGEEGVAMMKKSIYDIAFLDIDMPVMNGFDATPGARQPICALTATYVDDFELSELMKFKDIGLDVMESKPCNIPRLFKAVYDVPPPFSDLSISVTRHQG